MLNPIVVGGKKRGTLIGQSIVIPEKEALVTGTILRTTGPVSVDFRQ